MAFAAKLVKQRGHVTEAEVQAVKNAGYNDAQLVEIILHVALNTLTNCVNTALATDVDFPVVSPLGEYGGCAVAVSTFTPQLGPTP